MWRVKTVSLSFAQVEVRFSLEFEKQLKEELWCPGRLPKCINFGSKLPKNSMKYLRKYKHFRVRKKGKGKMGSEKAR